MGERGRERQEGVDEEKEALGEMGRRDEGWKGKIGGERKTDRNMGKKGAGS